MGMWVMYCSLCGCPFSDELAGNPKYDWLDRVVIKNMIGKWYYDYYGKFHSEKNSNEIFEPDTNLNGSCDLIHEECWKLNNKTFKNLRCDGPIGDPLLSNFQEQFFNVRACINAGLGWVLEDPNLNIRNRNRILALTAPEDQSPRVSKAQSPKSRSPKGKSPQNPRDKSPKPRSPVRSNLKTPRSPLHNRSTRSDLKASTVVELRAEAKRRDLKQYSKLRKEELIDFLLM